VIGRLRLCVSAVLGPLALVAPALLASAGAAHAATMTGTAAPVAGIVVSRMDTESGQLRFLLTPQYLKPGTSVDPARVAVRVGATVLASSAALATDLAGAPQRSLAVVLDATGSTSPAFRAAVGGAAIALAAAVPADVHLGLVVVGTKPVLALAPTADRTAFEQGVASVAYGGTANPVNGVDAAATALLATTGERRVLLFSDGQHAAASGRPTEVGSSLAGNGVGLDVVTLGATGSGLSVLTALATAAGGRALGTTDPATVTSHWQTAGRSFAPVLAVTVTVPTYLAGSTAALQVDLAGVGSTAVTATFARAAAAESGGTSILSWIPTWLGYVLALLVFVAIGLIVLALLWPRSGAHERIKQIANFGPARATPTRPDPSQSLPSGGLIARTALAASASVVRSGGLEERIALRLERAGMKLRPHEWLLLRTLITVGVAVLFGLLGGILAVPVGLIIGWLSTVAYQIALIERRARLFAEQLPDALQLVIGSLRSGFSLSQALESLVRESPHPIGAEFGRALAEHRLGADVSDALDRIAQRTRSEDLSWAVMAVRIQRDVGGNLAEILQTSVDTMRERARLRRHVRSLSAEGRLSAWVLICVPLALAGFMLLYRRSYLAPLFTDPRGLMMVIGGGILFVVGIFWMVRVIKVEA
jgi:Flp pilus assembly protein TadB